MIFDELFGEILNIILNKKKYYSVACDSLSSGIGEFSFKLDEKRKKYNDIIKDLSNEEILKKQWDDFYKSRQ